MASVNKVILIGNVGSAPELFYVNGILPLVKFSLATTHIQKNESATQWHKIMGWKDLAEYAVKSIHKGDLVYVEGKLRYQSWEDKQGKPQRDVEIEAFVIEKM